MKAGLKSWGGRVPDLSAVFTRFPVPVLLMAIFTIILILFDDLHRFRTNLGFLCIGLIAAAYACVNIVLAREAHGKSQVIILQLLLSAVIAALAWFSEDLRLLVPFIVGGGVLMLGNMVRWRKTRDDIHTWDFTHKIWTGAIFATAGSFIYLLGVLSIMFALKSLFGVDIKDLMERLLLPIGLGFLAPLYWLSTVPAVDEDASELYENPSFISKAVAFLGTWLLSPLTLIYALILLAYGLKIALTGELPKGEIAQLTTPFLIIGTGTWLVLDPPFVRDKPLAKIFRKSWFFLSMPAALLLAVAIGVRIEDYGLTWERIGLALCVVWAIALGLWFTFGPKNKRDIRLIPGLAAALMFAAAFIAQPLSFHNQKGRAISGLKDAGIMTEAGLILPKNEIVISDENAARKAKGALQYLERNKGWPSIEKMFGGAEDIPGDVGKFKSTLFDRLALNDVQLKSKRNLFYRNYYDKDVTVSVNGFERLSMSHSMSNHISKPHKEKGVETGFSFQTLETGLQVFYNDVEVTTYDVFGWVKSQPVNEHNILIDDPVISILDADSRRLHMIVTNVSHNGRNKNTENINVTFMLLSTGFE